MNLDLNIDVNISMFNDAFLDCGDFISRKFPIGESGSIFIYIAYIDGLVDRNIIENSILNNLLVQIRQTPPDDKNIYGCVFDAVRNGGFATADFKEASSFEELSLAVLSGDCVFLIDGYSDGIVVSTKGWPNRGVSQADTEMVLQGSKEAFSETIRINTALIRRRIRDTRLKIKQIQLGKRSNTDIAVVYLDDVVRKGVLREVLTSLNKIDIDAIMDSGYIEQLTENNMLSPFPLSQVTERPDKAAAAILEGRIAVIVDNTPFVMIVPTTFNVFFQSPEDYYQRPQIMSALRIIRYIACFITACLPGLYIAITVFHPSMVPTSLALKMASSRLAVPFPAVVEVIIMELTFEMLREAGTRLPQAIGSTIGIVGGLIIGQAAVEAGLVSPIIVIIVASTAISSFAVPNISLISGFRIMKFFIIIMASVLGLFGFWIAVLAVLIHLVSLKSYGFPYLFPFTAGDINFYSDIKDSFFRVPLMFMKKRPIFANPDETDR